MSNPYHGRPPYTFWKQGVSEATIFDPVVTPAFPIAKDDEIATAGSCFAQHIARTLVKEGYKYLVTEKYAAMPGVRDESFGVFPARFANIYTVRQLVQLFERAYGRFIPQRQFVKSRRGGFIDLLRPRIQENGFETIEQLQADHSRHLSAVRAMFERCNVFIFTLGLTEVWKSKLDRTVYPLAPGVVTDDLGAADFEFHNFSFKETVGDLLTFYDQLKSVNPDVKMMFTVSPVSLIATYEDRHVAVSTVASKSILRASVDELIRQRPDVAYFPSFEIITGPQSKGRFYESDMREVAPEGVAIVMSLFKRHYLGVADADAKVTVSTPSSDDPLLSEEDMQRMSELTGVICDETAIVQ